MDQIGGPQNQGALVSPPSLHTRPLSTSSQCRKEHQYYLEMRKLSHRALSRI